MAKMVVLDGYTENPGDLSWDGFKKFGDITVYDRTPKDEIVKRAKGFDVILSNKTVLSKDILSQLVPELKYIGVLATGYNVVDTAGAKELGITVTNIPSYGTDSVAQMVMALMLEWTNGTGMHSDSVKKGNYAAQPDYSYWHRPLVEVAGKTMGVIGFGRIGQRVGDLAEAFGMRVIAHDKFESDQSHRKNFAYVSLDDLYAQSDFISLNCNLTPENEKMINKDSLKKMKKNCVLINTARGQLVDEQELADALGAGTIAAACVDVWTQEPPAKDNPLIACDNAITTPHIAWASYEARARLMDMAIDNLGSFLAGKPVNVVNA